MAKPNKEQRAYQRQIEKMMRAVERPFAKDIAKEKNRYINKYVSNYKIGIKSDGLELHQSRIGQIINAYVSKAMPTFARHQINQFKSNKLRLEIKTVSSDLTKQSIQQYMNKFGYKKAGLIARTTYEDIRNVLSKYADIPVTDDELTKEIKDVSKLSAARSAIIARTETHNATQFANNFIGSFVEQTLEVEMTKAWVSSDDDRTREAHAEMDAENYIGLNDMFVVGDEELEYAGDPSGSAENIINCRCVTIYAQKEYS